MNKVVHFDVPVEDVKRATKFYQEAFGWRINEVPNMNYFILNTVETDENQMPKESGAINGGMYKKEDPRDDKAVIVVDVIDLDNHLKKIQKAGGKVVMEKREVGNMGFYARVADTEGNVIGVWQNKK
jgi:uncharacterized protein